MESQNQPNEFINKSIKFSFFLNIFILIIIIAINLYTHKNNHHQEYYGRLLSNIPQDEISSNNFLNPDRIDDYGLTSETIPYELKKRRFIDSMINHSYAGKWTSKNQFFDFDNKEGLFRLFFQNYIMRSTNRNLYNIVFFIHDGMNKDKWIIIQNNFPINYGDNSTLIKFNHVVNNTENNIEKNNIEYSNPVLQVTLRELENFKMMNIKNGKLRFNLDAHKINFNKFDNLNFNKNFTNFQTVRGFVHMLNGSLIGLDQSLKDFDINFEVVMEKLSLYHKIANFSMVLSILAGLQMFNSKSLMERFVISEIDALKFSSYVFVINTVWNGFICFTNFIISLYDDRMFNNFIAPTVIYFLNFSYFELRIIFHIWRAEIFRGNLQNTVEYSVQLTIFKNRLLKFYVFLYSSLFLIYVYGAEMFFNKTFLFIMMSITWLPQIWLNFKKGRRNYIPFTTILIISLNKLYVPLYFRLCLTNFFDVKQDKTFSYIIIGIMVFQILILVLQRIFGMRCLMPEFMLPKQFIYGKDLKELKKMEIELDNMTCSICLGSFIAKSDNEAENDLIVIPPNHNSFIKSCHSCMTNLIKKCNRENKNSFNFMYTPCKHLFHSDCLKAWLEVKNSCPECRSPLPIEQELSIV